MHFPPSWTPSRLLGVASAACVLSLLSCGRELRGPADGVRFATGLSFVTEFPGAMATLEQGAGSIIPFNRVRVFFTRLDGSRAFDQTFNFAANNVKRFVSDGSKVSFPKEIDDVKAEKALQWVKSLNAEGRELTVRLLNRLETWSMHFNHGLADPDVAFLPCATVYSSLVVVLYASIITQRHNDPRSSPYQNVVELFDRWYKKERMEKIQEEVSKLRDAGVFKAPPEEMRAFSLINRPDKPVFYSND